VLRKRNKLGIRENKPKKRSENEKTVLIQTEQTTAKRRSVSNRSRIDPTEPRGRPITDSPGDSERTREIDALKETSTAAVLIGYQGFHHDDVFRVGYGETIIGRSEQCNVIVKDPYASSRAVRIVARGGEFALESLSKRRIELNGRPLADVDLLRDGDLIKLGISVFSFRTTRPGDD
jgi:hypothetical protein